MEGNRLLTQQDISQLEKYNEDGVPKHLQLRPLLFLINRNYLKNKTCLNVLNIAVDTMLYKTFTKYTYLNISKNFNTELSKV